MQVPNEAKSQRIAHIETTVAFVMEINIPFSTYGSKKPWRRGGKACSKVHDSHEPRPRETSLEPTAPEC